MGNIIAFIILFLTIYICATVNEKKHTVDAAAMQYVSLDTSAFKQANQVYVPLNQGSKSRSSLLPGKTVLKIRNTSFTDSIYVSRIVCYDKQGKPVRNYIDSILLVKPMATTEILVKGKEFITLGDNFIVQWFSGDSLHKPIVQLVSLNADNRVVTTEHGTPVR